MQRSIDSLQPVQGLQTQTLKITGGGQGSQQAGSGAHGVASRALASRPASLVSGVTIAAAEKTANPRITVAKRIEFPPKSIESDRSSFARIVRFVAGGTTL